MFDPSLLRSLIWLDYRLAVIFCVCCPLILLVWAFSKRIDTFLQLLVIYWKVSSLFAITLYLLMGNFAIGFITAAMAFILSVICLWFWADVNDEIRERPPSALKFALTAWRWSMTVYGGLGILLQLPFLRCAFSRSALQGEACQIWFEPPQLFQQLFHGGVTNDGFLGFWGLVGLIIYLLCLGYFVFFRIGRQGRSALNQ